MNVRIGLFVAENVLIAVGMLYLGFKVILMAARNLRRTKWGGLLFFMAAAAINADQVITAIGNHRARNHLANWHSIGIRAVLLLGLYLLVTGLYLEYVRWGPWKSPSYYEVDEIKAEMARRWAGESDRRVRRDPDYTGPERRQPS
jgi:hypothetical protein